MSNNELDQFLEYGSKLQWNCVKLRRERESLAGILQRVINQCGTEHLGDQLWIDIKAKLAASNPTRQESSTATP